MRNSIKNLPVHVPRRTITIEFQEFGYKVSEGDRYIDGLCWDEMLGQIATMTLPRLDGGSLFSGMATTDWEAQRRGVSA